MKWDVFLQIQEICDELGIRPIIGVVPDNRDPNLAVDTPNQDFWSIIRQLSQHKWIVAQHGYQHIYNDNKSEFRGLSYEDQYAKIQRGKQILEKQLGFSPTWWMAPAHSFDDVTCSVLRDLQFTHVTDGAALFPYEDKGLVWVPQQLWKPRTMPFGTWTICLHPNTMSQQDLDALFAFLRTHAEQFHNVSFTPKTSMLRIPFQIVWNAIRALY
jgi:predicted deacetylase